MGRRIASVGRTGRADGCHLHFELWTAPGWYRGGRAYDPLGKLRQWDGWS
jgi:murein DD-endopeptidase MepM/ murein hydrolase activator NlpD